jgi:hypothetical protein
MIYEVSFVTRWNARKTDTKLHKSPGYVNSTRITGLGSQNRL